MDCSPAEFDVKVVCPEDQGKVPGFLVDLGSLYDYLARLEDRRDPRGVRYRLVHILVFVLLVFVLLGKLAGEDRLTGIAAMGVAPQGSAGPSFGVAAPPGAASHDLPPGPGRNAVG